MKTYNDGAFEIREDLIVRPDVKEIVVRDYGYDFNGEKHVRVLLEYSSEKKDSFYLEISENGLSGDGLKIKFDTFETLSNMVKKLIQIKGEQ